MVNVVKNLANITGVRPGIDGDQIIKAGFIINASSVIYTVPAGKILLLCNSSFYAKFGAVAGTGYIQISDTVPNGVYALGYYNGSINDEHDVIQRFDPEMELIEGWTIEGYSSSAITIVYYSIFGILVNATTVGL